MSPAAHTPPPNPRAHSAGRHHPSPPFFRPPPLPQAHLILKRDWLQHHLHTLPAVAALFFAWDSTAAIRVQQAIEAFRPRLRPSCRLVVVLVIEEPSPAAGGRASPGSNVGGKGAEAAGGAGDDGEPLRQSVAALRRAAELDSRSLLVLRARPVHATAGEMVASGSVEVEDSEARRLEAVLLEHALLFYKDETRRNRKPRQPSPRLQARWHLKRAVYAEMRRDGALAKRHWSGCYGALRQLAQLRTQSPEQIGYAAWPEETASRGGGGRVGGGDGVA